MQKPIILLGDCILDKYIVGDVSRISPEAPIPILAVENETAHLGGAGNVANNLQALQAYFELVYVAGKCPDSLLLADMLEVKGINARCYDSASNRTVVKTRIISGSQQIVRLDNDNNLAPTAPDLMISDIESTLSDYSLVVISDYDKGSVNNISSIIKASKINNLKVLVDPKKWVKGKYFGAFLVKPNYHELCEYLGYSVAYKDLESCAQKICINEDIEFLLVTMGKDGMRLFSKDGLLLSLCNLAREVFDVTGAGDTVLACLAALLQKGYTLNESVRLANKAAGIAVERKGVATICLSDILVDVNKNYRSERFLNNYILAERQQENSIVVTNGCFDILHSGHIKLLKEAAEAGDKLIVLLNSDDSVRRLKGDSRPINNENERAEILMALQFVDYVYIFDDDTPIKAIHKIKPDILVKGGDYMVEEVVGYSSVVNQGGRVLIVELEEGKSTSNLVKKIEVSLS